MKNRYKAPIVKKTFQILNQIARHKKGISISDLSRKLEISKGTVHGITSALQEQGAIARDPRTKRYTLGHTLFELGRAAYGRIDVKDIARPFMEDLMVKTGESVFLGVKNVDHVTIIDIVESSSDLKITSPIGTTIPLLAGATGKVFLAHMSEAQVTHLLQSKGIRRYTENTVTRITEFVKQTRAAEKNGFAIDEEEYISGVRAVAAPIHNNGSLLAAIWVVGFSPSMDDEKMTSVIKAVKEAAHSISQTINTQTATA